MKTFRLLTYNIHKGFSALNRKFVLQNIRKSIVEVHADLVCLQEVIGQHETHSTTIEDWPSSSQFEYLAEKVWPHYAYGKNSVYTEGHHGNAILSKYPITFSENQDVSLSKIERRGLLHTIIDLPESPLPLHAFSVHLGLFERDRATQIQRLCKRISAMIPKDAPVIVAGDFNDWKKNATDLFAEELKMKEAFSETCGAYARTFPSIFPTLALDRIYFRNLNCTGTRSLHGKTWNKLSDHLPLLAEFEWIAA